MAVIHAFGDDALGDHDAVTLARLVKNREVSAAELAEAAVARARLVDPELHPVVPGTAGVVSRPEANENSELFGVPTFVKDNTDVAGLPTGHGSEAFTARVASKNGPYTVQLLSTGLTVIGKSRLPEFGFSATTEFMTQPPVRNPWNPDYSIGASSGGSAALVAAGVVPIAHGNDGGGSLRIPAACAGLVALKPSRGRHIDGPQAAHLPVRIVSEGVLTRTVGDTAAYVAASENHWRNPRLPSIGQVLGPASRVLRVGVLVDSITGGVVDAPTLAAVQDTAEVLASVGHVVDVVDIPVNDGFADDFVQYYALLADLSASTARIALDRRFDITRIDGLTRGLRAHHRRSLSRTPGALRRLRAVARQYATMFARHEVVLSPVLSQVAPPIGHLAPTVEFPVLIDRLRRYVAYTPLNNVAGTPAISLPMGRSPEGVPVGVQLSAAYGDDRTLLELAYQLEELRPFARIQDHGPRVANR